MRVNRKLAELTSAVYFIQGALGLSAVALPLYLREAGLDIGEIATLSSITSIPWLLKPVFAALSDKFPLWGYRRKTYIAVSSAVSAIGWWFMASIPTYSTATGICMFIANIGFATTDVVTDGLVVEHSDEHTSQTYQSLSWGLRSLGAIVSGILGGWLTLKLGYRTVFAFTGFLPLLSLAISFAFHENRIKPQGKPAKRSKETAVINKRFKKILNDTSGAFKTILITLSQSIKLILKGDLFWFSILLLLGTVSASFATPLFFYFKDRIGIHETLLGTIQSLSWVGAVIGCAIYYRFLKKVELRKALGFAISMDVLSTLLCLLMLNRFSAITLSFLTGIMAYLTLLPLMAASAKLAHGTGIEGSLFAILMSVRNIGVVASTFVGGYMYHLVGLRILILFSAIATASGLIIIKKLKTLAP